MSLQLPGSVEQRYEALAALNWPYPEGYQPVVLPEGTRVNILRRGCFTTDAEGITLSVNGISQAEVMRGTLNHAWDIWVRPEINRYREQNIELPEKVGSILIKAESDEMRMYVNEGSGKGHMMIKPGYPLQEGEGITSKMVLDILDVMPPMYLGKPTPYFLVLFHGEQIALIFDMRPGPVGDLDTWSLEDQKWYGSALAEQLLAGVYGHLVLHQQYLIDCNLPFSLGLNSDKMNALARAAKDGVGSADQYLKENLSIDDWKPLVNHWMSSDSWKHRQHLFEEALLSYQEEYFAAVVALLLPQVEGTIMEYLVAKGKGVRSNGQSKRWSSETGKPSVIKDLEEDFLDKDYGYVRLAIAYTLLDFLKRSTLYSGFSWRDGGKPIGRHPILHGYEVSFGKKENADRLLMVLDSLFWLIGANITRREDERG